MARPIVEVKIEGFPLVSKKFNTLPGRVRKKHLRPAMRAGAKIIKNAAVSLVSVDEGKLRKSLKVKSPKRSRVRFGVMIQTGTAKELGIKETKNRGYYPMSLEYLFALCRQSFPLHNAFAVINKAMQSLQSRPKCRYCLQQNNSCNLFERQ